MRTYQDEEYDDDEGPQEEVHGPRLRRVRQLHQTPGVLDHEQVGSDDVYVVSSHARENKNMALTLLQNGGNKCMAHVFNRGKSAVKRFSFMHAVRGYRQA